MSPSPDNNAEHIERLLDEKIKQDTSAPREDSIQEESLEQSLRFQETIDGSLKRLFKAPDIPSELVAELTETSPSLPTPLPSKKILGLPPWVVAAVLLIGVGSWTLTGANLINQFLFPEADPYSEKMAVAMYRESVSHGFKPDWFCEDEKQFAETFAERQGQGLLLKPLPDTIRMAGLAYLKGLSEKTTCMLAWVEEKPVLLLVDITKQIPEYLLEDDKSNAIQVFTRKLDNLTIVEVTPFQESRVADYLYPADPPREKTGRVPGT